jgi:hypothetical protein
LISSFKLKGVVYDRLLRPLLLELAVYAIIDIICGSAVGLVLLVIISSRGSYSSRSHSGMPFCATFMLPF